MAELMVADQVRKTYFRKGRDQARDFDAVADVSLTLYAGQLLAIKGRSGSGKTTLLSMMAGLLRPSSGTISLSGQDLYALDDAARARLRNESFGIIPQGHTPLADLTVLENVTLPAHLYGSGDGATDRALSLLRDLGIEALSETPAGLLSGGEMRRMALARALVCDPRVIFADEVTADLDDENTELVLNILRRRSDAGAVVVLVTHDAAAEAFADEVLTMSEGAFV